MKTKKMALTLVLIVSLAPMVLSSFSMVASFSMHEEKDASGSKMNECGISNIQSLKIIPNDYNHGVACLKHKMNQRKTEQ